MPSPIKRAHRSRNISLLCAREQIANVRTVFEVLAGTGRFFVGLSETEGFFLAQTEQNEVSYQKKGLEKNCARILEQPIGMRNRVVVSARQPM